MEFFKQHLASLRFQTQGFSTPQTCTEAKPHPTHRHTHTSTHVHAHTHIHTCTCTHTSTQVHAHTHTHQETPGQNDWRKLLSKKKKKITYQREEENVTG